MEGKEPSFDELLAQLTQEVMGKQQANSLEQYREILPFLIKEGEIAVELFKEVMEKFVEYLEVIRKTVVESRIKTFKEYVGAGMSEDNAVRLMIHDQTGLQQGLQNLKVEKK